MAFANRFLLSCLVVSSIALAQDVPEQKTIDLSIRAEPGRALKMTLRGSIRNGEIKIPSIQTTMKLKGSRKLVFVDRFTKVEKGDVESERRYTEAQMDFNGSRTDPPLAGVHLKFRERNDKVSFSMLNGLRLPNDLQDAMLAQVTSVGGWLALPKEAVVGESYSAGLYSFGALLVGFNDTLKKADAKLKFESFDEKKGIALLVGDVVLQGAMVSSEADLNIDLKGELTLRIKVAEGRLESARLVGDVHASGTLVVPGPTPELPVIAKWKENVSLDVDTGKAAEAIFKRKAKHRTVTRTASDARLGIDLPAHWFVREAVGADDIIGTDFFGDYLELQVRTFETPDPDTTVRSAVETSVESNPKAKVSQGGSSLGKLKSVRIEGKSGPTIIDFIAGKQAVHRLVWISTGKSARELEKARRAALKKLSRLN